MREAESMNILQKIVVKQVLTEKSRAELHQKYEESLLQLKKECEQLRFELKTREDEKISIRKFNKTI